MPYGSEASSSNKASTKGFIDLEDEDIQAGPGQVFTGWNKNINAFNVENLQTIRARGWKIKPPPKCPFKAPWFIHALLLPWYIDDPEEPRCPSRCCKRLDRCCCRCCGLGLIRHMLLSIGLLFLLWVLWSMFVGLSLLRMEPKAVVNFAKVGTLCTRTIPLHVQFEMESQSFVEIQMTYLNLEVRKKGDPRLLGTMAYRADTAGNYPEMLKVSKGSQLVDFKTNLELSDLQGVADTASLFFNQQEFDLDLTIDAGVYTGVLWMPLSVQVGYEMPLTFNKKLPGEQVKKGPVSPLAFSIDARPNQASNIGTSIWSWWQLDLADRLKFEVIAPVPHVVMQVHHEDEKVAFIHVHPFQLRSNANLTVDVMIENNLTARQLWSAQKLVGDFLNNQNLSVVAYGKSNKKIRDFPVISNTIAPDIAVETPVYTTLSSGQCVLQDIVDLMPAVMVQVPAKLPCSVPVSVNGTATDPSLLVNNYNCLPVVDNQGIMELAPKQTIFPRVIEPTFVRRNDTHNLTAGGVVDMIFDTPFTLAGEFPSLFFDFKTFGEPMLYLKTKPLEILPGATSALLEWELHTVDEPLLGDRLLGYSGLDSLGLSMQGRTGENLLSDIAAGVQLNFTEKEPLTEKDSNEMRLQLLDSPGRFSIVSKLSNRAGLPFELRVPTVDANLQANRVATASANASLTVVKLTIHNNTFKAELDEGKQRYLPLLDLFIGASHASQAGQFISQFASGDRFAMALTGAGARRANSLSAQGFTLDFRLSNISSSFFSSSSSSSSSSS
eukprot:CAMPEP_0175122042 /NCGR_PEP_ID=MMETSP0087-20121206/1502_1 /TAXON_ID=136419 /ORGANISM="Unknown Unknown, Strain D1" /LENGTH=776 /DNA_ID=CAMNT_0016403647 /DNA_START=127 /DNA_END=2453 /DNA_ORIENTATION=-